MSKLEECLDLFEKIENPEQNYKRNKQLLNDGIDELLKNYGFNPIKEDRDMKLYATGEEVFIKFWKKDSHDYKNEYCWALSRIDTIDFYKKFKKTIKTSFYDNLVSIASGFVTGGLFFSLAHGWEEPGLGASAFIFLGLTGMLCTSYFLASRNEIKLKENCKEIYYGKEALEKAFRR